MLDAVADSVGIVKPQVAFFEQFGSAGFLVLERFLEAAKQRGLLVIADAKRGDIGSTMDGYALAWLSKTSPFIADALTVSSYLGPESTEGMVQIALENGKGILKYTSSGNLIWSASSVNPNVSFHAIDVFSEDQIVLVGSENANAFVMKTRTDFTGDAGTLSDEIRLTYNLPDIITYDLPVALGANPGFTASGPLFSTPNTSIAFNALANATTNTVTFGY
jgi:hypothetical protein